MTTKTSATSHNPTPEERDERFSLYGLNPEKVIEAVLNTEPEDDETNQDQAKHKQTRRK